MRAPKTNTCGCNGHDLNVDSGPLQNYEDTIEIVNEIKSRPPQRPLIYATIGHRKKVAIKHFINSAKYLVYITIKCKNTKHIN